MARNKWVGVMQELWNDDEGRMLSEYLNNVRNAGYMGTEWMQLSLEATEDDSWPKHLDSIKAIQTAAATSKKEIELEQTYLNKIENLK